MKCPSCGVEMADGFNVCSACGCEIYVGAKRNELLARVNREFEDWEKKPPNFVTKGMGKITAPIDFVLGPITKKIAPAFEKVVSGLNNLIASALKDGPDTVPEFENMDEKEFSEWFTKADISAKNWRTGGILAMGAEGLMGAGGLFLIIPDIAAAFGGILLFANKIALSYGLPIKAEETQIAILQAISAGSANNVKDKASAVYTLKITGKTLQKSWKQIYKTAADNVLSIEKVIMVVRELLKKIGINITKKKAMQLIPAIGAGVGIATNAAWATGALEAVRQYSRQWAVENYVSARREKPE
jgi:hypothetical protein